MGLNIEKLKNIVISLEMATTVEVEVRKVVVVSEPMVVVEVQER